MTNIYLTYDDGPDNILTDKILDVLNIYNIKGTFYFLGNRSLQFPNVVLRAYIHGHRIGNHTFTHGQLNSPQGFPGLNGSELIINEILPTNEILKNIIGVETNLYRPPFLAVYGDQRTFIESAGFFFDIPTIDPRDWETNITSHQIFERTIEDIVENSNNIILLHSGSPYDNLVVATNETVLATQMIIEYGIDKGYIFKYIGQ